MTTYYTPAFFQIYDFQEGGNFLERIIFFEGIETMDLNKIILENQITIMNYLLAIENDKQEPTKQKASKDLKDRVVATQNLLRFIV